MAVVCLFVCLCVRVMLNKLVCIGCDLLCLFVMLHGLFLSVVHCVVVSGLLVCVVGLRLSVGVNV